MTTSQVTSNAITLKGSTKIVSDFLSHSIQQILYQRVSLSDDPQAKAMKDNIMDSAEMFGFPKN